jgi:hypothetical protein
VGTLDSFDAANLCLGSQGKLALAAGFAIERCHSQSFSMGLCSRCRRNSNPLGSSTVTASRLSSAFSPAIVGLADSEQYKLLDQVSFFFTTTIPRHHKPISISSQVNEPSQPTILVHHEDSEQDFCELADNSMTYICRLQWFYVDRSG